MKKKVKILIIVLVALIISFGLYSVSSFIVKHGYNSEDKLRDEIQEAEDNQPKIDPKDSMEYKEPDNDSGYSEVEVLYNSENLEDRREEFLDKQNNFEKYIDIIGYIEDNAKDVFKNLELGEESLSVDAEKILNASFDVSYDWKELLGYKSVYVKNGATVIDMFDGKYVICSYNYYFNDKIQLFVVDYSKSLFNVNYKTLIDFGQENPLLLYPDKCFYERVGNIDIVYFKEI